MVAARSSLMGICPPCFEGCEPCTVLQMDAPLLVCPPEGRPLALEPLDLGPDRRLPAVVDRLVIGAVVDHVSDGGPNGPVRGARAAFNSGFMPWPNHWSRPSAVSSRPTGGDT